MIKLVFGIAYSNRRMFGSMDKEYVAKLVKQSAAGLFFSICSILIVFVNKLVLTTYRFVQEEPVFVHSIYHSDPTDSPPFKSLAWVR